MDLDHIIKIYQDIINLLKDGEIEGVVNYVVKNFDSFPRELQERFLFNLLERTVKDRKIELEELIKGEQERLGRTIQEEKKILSEEDKKIKEKLKEEIEKIKRESDLK